VNKEKESTSSTLTVRVSSAVPLTGEEQGALREKLEARFSQNLDLDFETEPSLLGGVVVRIGGQIIDGSAKGRLEALKQTLAPRR
jgi:F-type H+-transporting ATPase subunit delta